MDPNQALADIRRLISEADSQDTDTPEGAARALSLLTEAAWAFDGLDEWMSRGGFMPKIWARAQKPHGGERRLPRELARR